MHLNEIIDMSIFESELMEEVEIPVDQTIDWENVYTEIKGSGLDIEAKKILETRMDKIQNYRKRIAKYLDFEPTDLFKQLFGREPSGNVSISPSYYHLVVTGEKGEFDDITIDRCTHAKLPYKSKKVLIPELRGLVEISVPDPIDKGINKILDWISDKEIENQENDLSGHEREHVRHEMVVTGPKDYKIEMTFPEYMFRADNFKEFYHDRARSELLAIIAEGCKIYDVGVHMYIDELKNELINKIDADLTKLSNGPDDSEGFINMAKRNREEYILFFELLHQDIDNITDNLNQDFNDINMRHARYVLGNIPLKEFSDKYAVIKKKLDQHQIK